MGCCWRMWLGSALPAGIADTVAAPTVEEPLEPGAIDPPTLRFAPLAMFSFCANMQQAFTMTCMHGSICMPLTVSAFRS